MLCLTILSVFFLSSERELEKGMESKIHFIGLDGAFRNDEIFFKKPYFLCRNTFLYMRMRARYSLCTHSLQKKKKNEYPAQIKWPKLKSII